MKREIRIEKRIKRKQWKEMQGTRKARQGEGWKERDKQKKKTYLKAGKEQVVRAKEVTGNLASSFSYQNYGELSHPKSHINGIQKTENGIKEGNLNSRMLLAV